MLRRSGETLTAAVRNALAERLERERLKRGEVPDLLARIREIQDHLASLSVYDDRSPDEIVGCDENGMW